VKNPIAVLVHHFLPPPPDIGPYRRS
jgi:hypothetical protein